MNNEFLVSIIVPIYNVENYLVECIDSIKNQTCPNFEVICIEDCSTDNSLAILKECIKDDDRFRIIRNDSNHGLSYNRNIGIKEARCKYISFVDSDDFISPNYVEILIGLFNRYDVEGISFENTEFIDGDNHFYDRERNSILNGVMSGEDVLHIGVCEGIYNCESPFYIWNREFLMSHGLYFYEGIYHEDNLFFFETMINCKKLLLIHDKLYNYRKREKSIVNQSINIRHLESMLCICDEIRKDIESLTERVYEDAKRYLKLMEYAFCDKLIKYNYSNFIMNKSMISSFLGIEVDEHKKSFDYVLSMLSLISMRYYFFTINELNRINKYESIIVYGAGAWARSVVGGFFQNDIDEFIVAVTDNSKGGKLFGNEILQLDQLEVDYDNTLVILAVGKKYVDEMQVYAQKLGFKNFLRLRYE